MKHGQFNEVVEVAAALAKELHKGRKDKGGKDYFCGHLSAVGSSGKDWKEQTVGYLHDVAEDTDCTVDRLMELLQSKASASVKLKEGNADGLPERSDWEEIREALELLNSRTAGSREEYINRFRGHSLAIRVKLNDLRNNMDLTRIPCPTDKDRARAERYRKEFAELSAMLETINN